MNVEGTRDANTARLCCNNYQIYINNLRVLVVGDSIDESEVGVFPCLLSGNNLYYRVGSRTIYLRDQTVAAVAQGECEQIEVEEEDEDCRSRFGIVRYVQWLPVQRGIVELSLEV